MNLFHLRLLSLLAWNLWATVSQAAGFTPLQIPASQDGPALQGAVWTPCGASPGPITLGPITITGVRDCPVAGRSLPLIVLSHGSGGSALGHHDTAAILADAGFVVAAINHPGDNYQDTSAQAHLSAFATRPVDMRRLIDHMLSAWPGHAALDAKRIGFFGFSRGGYTGLALIGAVPNWALRRDLCPPDSTQPLCEEVRQQAWPAPPTPDPRIRVAVIADPLSVFDDKGLAHVTVPVQLWASALGGDGVTPESVAAVRHGLPNAPDWHVVADAGHFAFLAPCSTALADMAPGLCRDGAGFSRATFHTAFNTSVLAFFQQHIGPPTPP